MELPQVCGLFVDEVMAWCEYFFIRNFPGKTGLLLRRLYWAGKVRGSQNLSIAQGCIISNPGSIVIGGKANIMNNNCLYAANNGFIEIGSNVSINSNTILDASDNGKIYLGNDVLIGPNVVIRASNHKYAVRSETIKMQGHTSGNIVIEDDVWLGANCVVLDGAHIGKGSIIGAGSVVNNDIPPYSLAAGVPAKVIKGDCRT